MLNCETCITATKLGMHIATITQIVQFLHHDMEQLTNSWAIHYNFFVNIIVCLIKYHLAIVHYFFHQNHLLFRCWFYEKIINCFYLSHKFFYSSKIFDIVFGREDDFKVIFKGTPNIASHKMYKT